MNCDIRELETESAEREARLIDPIKKCVERKTVTWPSMRTKEAKYDRVKRVSEMRKR
jgi:hypothetical protein